MKSWPVFRIIFLALGISLRALGQTAPFVHTLPAGPISNDDATLNGMLTPNGLSTIAWFEWGTNRNYGQIAESAAVYDGTAVKRVKATTGPLISGSVYHFRLVASNALGVVYGSDHVVRVASLGKVAAWGGQNIYGETTVTTGLSNIVAIVGGPSQSYALREDGTVRRWGRIVPGTETLETSLSNVVMVSASLGHVLALLDDGTVRSQGFTMVTNVPAGLSNIVAIAAGGSDGTYFSLAVKDNGTIVAWGQSTPQITVPASATNVIAVAAGSYHSLALRADGRVIAWGNNAHNVTNLHPGFNSNIVAIAAARFQNCALRSDGIVLNWGEAGFSVAGPSNYISIAAGYPSIALKEDGIITALYSPGFLAIPPGLTNVSLISGGSTHYLAIGRNAAPTVSGLGTWTYPNTDRTIQIFPPADPNNDPLQLYIKNPPTTGVLYQYDSGSRGAPILTTNTIVTDPLLRVIYSPPLHHTNDIYGAYSYAVTDGELHSATAYVTMQIFMPTAPLLSSQKSQKTSSGDFQLNFSGQTGATYRVWASTNLSQWEVLGFATRTSNGWYQFIDSNVVIRPQRFYRAGAP